MNSLAWVSSSHSLLEKLHLALFAFFFFFLTSFKPEIKVKPFSADMQKYKQAEEEFFQQRWILLLFKKDSSFFFFQSLSCL